MTVSDTGIAHGTGRDAGAPAAWHGRAVAAALPFLVILLWTAAVRLPFYRFGDTDEFLFAVIARAWLHGGLPYVTAFDIKPPGIFLIYATAQALFGASMVTIKGLEIVATAFGASMLFVMLRKFGGGRLAIWSAALYPVYTLAFDGTTAVNMILQLPFVVAAFAAVVAATGEGADVRRRLAGAFLAGLTIGAAGMIKQTAVFEAAAAFIMLGVYGAQGQRVKMLALFVAGAALPVLAFSVYFLAVGHFGEMFNAVIVLAMHRLDPDILAAYGAKAAPYLTLPGALWNAVNVSVEVSFLWGSAALALLRLARIRSQIPARLLVMAATWLALALVSAAFGRLITIYYLLGTVPPLLILSGAFFCYGLSAIRVERRATLGLLIALAIITFGAGDYRKLYAVDPWVFDHGLIARTTKAIKELGPKANDRLLVLSRGTSLYITTGLRPPTPYFHSGHMMTAFRTPVDNPLAVSLAADPRFIVYADPKKPMLATLPRRYHEAAAYLAAHYRLAAREKGKKDSFLVYEFDR